MELGGGRGSQLEEEDTPYIVEEQIQPLSTNSACAARYYRKAGAVQGWEGTDIKNYIRGYFRRVGVDAKTRRGSTVS